MVESPRRQRGGALGALAILTVLGVAGLTSCGSPEPAQAPAGEAAVPPSLSLAPLWSRPTDLWGPDVTSGRWWLVSTDTTGGPGPSFPPRVGSLQVGDAMTGKVRPVANPGSAFVCDLSGLPPDPSTGAGRFVVETQSDDESGDCAAALLEVTPEGHRWHRPAPVDVTPSPEPDRVSGETAVGTWEGITVVATFDSVRGEDADGTTVWSTPLGHRDSRIFLFDWTETVVPTAWGPMLVSYDFVGPGPVPDLGDQPDAALSLLDPTTGQATREVDQVPADADFLWIVGDVAIFATGGDYVSTYDGYRLTDGQP